MGACGCAHLAQHDGARALAQAGRQGAQAEVAADASQTDLQVGHVLLGRIDAGARGHRQGTADRAQAGHAQAAAGDHHFLDALAVGEFDLHAANLRAQGLAQCVDAHRGVGAHAHAGKAVEAGLPIGHQGVAGAAFGLARDVQAQIGIAHTDAGPAGTKAGIDAGGCQQNLAGVAAADSEVAADLTEAGHAQRHAGATQIQATAQETGGEGAADRQASQALHHRRAAEAAAAGIARPERERAAGVFDADIGAAAAQAHAGALRVHRPDAVGAALFQGDLELAGHKGAANVDAAADRDLKAWQGLGQHQRLAGRQRQGLCIARPVDDRLGRVAGVLGGVDQSSADRVIGAVDAELSGLQVLQAVAGHRYRTQAGAGGDPAARAGVHGFGADHRRDVDAAQRGDAVGARAQRRRDLGPADDQLIDLHLRAVAQGHGLTQAAFNGQLPADRQGAGQGQFGLTAQAGLVAEQAHRVVGRGRGHRQIEVLAPAVVADLQGRIQAQARGLQCHCAVGLQGHFAGDGAAAVDLVAQQQRAAATAQAGAGAAQGQGAAGVFKADAQVGGDHAVDQLAGGDELEVALHMAQAIDIDAAVGDQQLLPGQAVVKAQGGAAAHAGGYGHGHRFAHGVDPQLSARAQADAAAKAAERGLSGHLQGVAGAGVRPLLHQQGQLAVLHRDAGAAAADLGGDIARADQQALGADGHCAREHSLHRWQAGASQRVDEGDVEDQRLAGPRCHLDLTGIEVRQHANQPRQRLGDLLVAQADQVEVGRAFGRAGQLKLNVGGPLAAGHGQRQGLYWTDQQAGHIAAGQVTHKPNVELPAGTGHRTDLQVVDRADAAQAGQGHAQGIGREGGGIEDLGAARAAFERQAQPGAAGRQVQALYFAAGAGLPGDAQGGIGRGHRAGDAPLHDVEVHAVGCAAKGHLPDLAASGFGEQLHRRFKSLLGQGLTGAVLGCQQGRLHLCCGGIEGQGATDVGAALEPQAELEGADHRLVIQAHRLHRADGTAAVALRAHAGAQAAAADLRLQCAHIAGSQAAGELNLKTRLAQAGRGVVGHAHIAAAQAGLQCRLNGAGLLQHRVAGRALAQGADLHHDVAARGPGLER